MSIVEKFVTVGDRSDATQYDFETEEADSAKNSSEPAARSNAAAATPAVCEADRRLELLCLLTRSLMASRSNDAFARVMAERLRRLLLMASRSDDALAHVMAVRLRRLLLFLTQNELSMWDVGRSVEPFHWNVLTAALHALQNASARSYWLNREVYEFELLLRNHDLNVTHGVRPISAQSS